MCGKTSPPATSARSIHLCWPNLENIAGTALRNPGRTEPHAAAPTPPNPALDVPFAPNQLRALVVESRGQVRSYAEFIAVHAWGAALSKFRISAFFISLLLAAGAAAQNPRGSIRGTVQDPTGARIASAKVVLQAANSSLRRETISEDRGEFRLDDVLPGSYHLLVYAPGFAQAQADVIIAVTSVRDVTVTLKPSGIAETVSVTGRASSITTETTDTSSAVRGGVVGSHDLQSLPLPARSFANIAYLVPGTEPVEPSDPTKARITAVSTGGSSGQNNELSVDGADNSDDYIGGFLQNFSPEAIEEFSMRTAQEDADSGGSTAGSVVITTRSGTNNWHSTAAFYERATALNARFPIENPVPDPKQSFSRQNYVGTLGGPIQRSRIWFFTSYEQV